MGIELIPERAELARKRVPTGVVIHHGDAISAGNLTSSFDIVFQSVVFSSLLDDSYQEELARTMWSWVKPGGVLVSYDFVVNNPANQDVRGVPLERLKELFPQGLIEAKRVTLAPPISRRLCRISPNLYYVANVFPFLRTHLLAFIRKS